MTKKLLIITILSAMLLTIPLTSCIFIPGGFPVIGPQPRGYWFPKYGYMGI